tara:strand:- start:40 stop:588 length:549 start_codon:yes stop_codon:yes gene_type:complete
MSTLIATNGNITNVNTGTIKDSTGNTTAMTIDSVGRVIKPSQISYCVISTAGNQALSASAVVGLVPQSPNSSSNGFHNIGGHFNVSNGTFTAPIAGRYLLHCSYSVWFTGGSLSDGWQIRSLLNGSANHDFYHSGGSAGYEGRANATCILDLSVSDYVSFQMQGYGGTATLQHHIFYGYLLG